MIAATEPTRSSPFNCSLFPIPCLNQVQTKSRPGPDSIQTKSRLNMPFLNTLILFRNQVQT
jgi:hypothetical protein